MNEALWYLGRGTGTVALVMFTVALVLGIATRSGRSGLGLSRFAVADLHRTAALCGVWLVGLHVGTLLLDPYAQLRLVDVVVPFRGTYHPFALALGTLALDVLVAIALTSLLRHRVGPRGFRTVHLGTYVLWPLALVHGLGIGSDAASGWFTATAAACAAAVATAVGWRLLPSFAQRGQHRTPRSVVSR